MMFWWAEARHDGLEADVDKLDYKTNWVNMAKVPSSIYTTLIETHEARVQVFNSILEDKTLRVVKWASLVMALVSS